MWLIRFYSAISQFGYNRNKGPVEPPKSKSWGANYKSRTIGILFRLQQCYQMFLKAGYLLAGFPLDKKVGAWWLSEWEDPKWFQDRCLLTQLRLKEGLKRENWSLIISYIVAGRQSFAIWTLPKKVRALIHNIFSFAWFILKSRWDFGVKLFCLTKKLLQFSALPLIAQGLGYNGGY